MRPHRRRFLTDAAALSAAALATATLLRPAVASARSAPNDRIAFALVGSGLLAALGIIAGIWVEKFDQLAAFQNFIVMPLTFLAGVFYSVQTLPPFWQTVSRLNPFFYAVDGFRYGFFGQADVAPAASLAIATGAFAAISWLTLFLLQRGYKLRH